MGKMLRMCLNWKVLAGLAAVAVGVGIYRPSLLGAALPVLILAVCPLSMMLMMRRMNHENTGSTGEAPTLPDDPDALRARMTVLAAEQEWVSEQLAHLAISSSSSEEGSEEGSKVAPRGDDDRPRTRSLRQ